MHWIIHSTKYIRNALRFRLLDYSFWKNRPEITGVFILVELLKFIDEQITGLSILEEPPRDSDTRYYSTVHSMA